MRNSLCQHICRVCAAIVVLWPLLCLAPSARAAESEEAGAIQFAFGQVLLDQEPLSPDVAGLYSISEKRHLSTKDGLVEVALFPRSSLRLGGNSEFEMLSADVSDVKVRLVRGSAIVDGVKKSGKHAASLLYGEAVVQFQKGGLYRIDAVAGAPARLRVFRGQVLVSVGGSDYKVKAKQAFLLAGAATVPEKFNTSDTDALDKWSKDRAKELKLAERSDQRMTSGDIMRELPTMR